MSQNSQVPCPLCGVIGQIYKPARGYRGILQCSRCGHVFAAAVPTGESALYDASYFEDRAVSYAEFLAGEPHRWRTDFYHGLLKRLEALTEGRRLLDLGCGVGEFLLAAGRRGWEAEGVDVSEAACRIAAQRTGCAVRAGILESLSIAAESFDAVAMLDVIEHVPDPRGTLTVVRRILKPGGFVLLVTVNLRGLSTRLFGAHNYALDASPAGPGHCHFFTAQTLSGLLQSTGYEPMAAETRDIYIHNLTLCLRRLTGQPDRMEHSGRSAQGRTGAALRAWLQNNALAVHGIAVANTLLLRPLGLGDQLVVFARRGHGASA